MKKIMLIGIFLIILASLSILSNATLIPPAPNCLVSQMKDSLKRNLYLQLTNMPGSTISLNEAKDLLIFYLNIPKLAIIINCQQSGFYSHSQIRDIALKGMASNSTAPKCSDGTEYGECSLNKPRYCYNGNLIDKCTICGCPANKICDGISCRQ